MADLDLPTGTVTFLFTDLEGSTKLLQAHPEAYRAAVRRHHDLLREAVEAHGGAVFETVGDAVYAAFARPTAAVAAALAGQLALQQESWGEVGGLRARMGVHLGEVERQGGHYFGAPLYRCARLMATAHGGQTVLSAAVAELVRDALPAGAGLHDLGEHRLKDLARPERVAQLVHPGLPAVFPPLRSLDARPHNLPRQATPFVGRAAELAAVVARLGQPEGPLLLLTLTGPGGTGKTRLALQAAAEALDLAGPDGTPAGAPFPDGVWLVELAPLTEPGLVLSAVAQALGVREAAGRPPEAALREHLREKRLLLVLDNGTVT
jgi:class 3 adenylate cyclase